MSTLKIDNPAKRLLDILKTGKKISSMTTGRSAWLEILEASDISESLLNTRIGKIMGLPECIVQTLQDHFPEYNSQSMHWRDKTEHAFYSQSLGGAWSNFISHIDNQTISELTLLSLVFETRGSHSVIDANEVERLITKVNDLRNDIRNSDLSANLKNMLLKQLAQLYEALETYSVLGIEPLMDAIQSTVGLAVINEEYRNEISPEATNEFGKRISSVLGEIANVITVVGALPALPVVIQSALNFLSK